jgi:hypothetical protein
MKSLSNRLNLLFLTSVAVLTQATGTSGTITGSVSFNAFSGVGFNGTIGSFTDSIGNEPVSNYTAQINWGDGSFTGIGTITAQNQSAGQFNIIGGHTYTSTGPFTVSLSINDSDGDSAHPSGTVNVSNALSGQINVGSLDEGASFNNMVLANFTDAITGQPISNYTAQINWGDDSPVTTGTISSTGPGQYAVSGSHVYGDEGNYTMTIALSDTNGSSRTLTGSVSVADALTLLGTNPVAFTPGTPFNVVVASFSDGSDISDYTASIDWGDGSPITAAVITAQGNTFQVRGSHTYVLPQAFVITGTITDDAPGGKLTFETSASTLPEPASLALSLIGGLACWAAMRKRVR